MKGSDSRHERTIRCFVFLLLVETSPGQTGGAESHFQVTQVPRETVLCAFDEPTKVLSLRSTLVCSAACRRGVNCMNFNYFASKRICHLFSFRPKCYEPSSTCRHYQVVTSIKFATITRS